MTTWERLQNGETIEINGIIQYRLTSHRALEYLIPGDYWKPAHWYTQVDFDTFDSNFPHAKIITITHAKGSGSASQDLQEQSITEALYSFRYQY